MPMLMNTCSLDNNDYSITRPSLDVTVDVNVYWCVYVLLYGYIIIDINNILLGWKSDTKALLFPFHC